MHVTSQNNFDFVRKSLITVFMYQIAINLSINLLIYATVILCLFLLITITNEGDYLQWDLELFPVHLVSHYFSLWFITRSCTRMTYEGCYMNEHAYGALVH